MWSDDPSKEKGTTPDNWTFDDAAGRYYMHRFQPFQPDLDITNPEVRHQIAKTVGFWLQLGVSGFRMDAVPFLCETVGTDEAGSDEPRRWLHALREFALRRRGDAMLMGEVNVEEGELESYFEDHGDALHLQLGFLINQRLWLSLARGEAAPLEDLIRTLPVPPHDSGWATFLRNHDELSLDKLDEAEREDVFAAFGPEKDMQIYGHGIRRRAASMLGGDGPRLRMAWSLLLSLPGTPVMLYGDEIGMVEDLGREGRMAVRVPMEWDEVDEQRRDDDSLLRFMSQARCTSGTTRPSSAGARASCSRTSRRRCSPTAATGRTRRCSRSTTSATRRSPPSSTWATTSTASTTCSSAATTASRAGGCRSSSAPTATCGCARGARAESRRPPRPRPRRRPAAACGSSATAAVSGRGPGRRTSRARRGRRAAARTGCPCASAGSIGFAASWALMFVRPR